MSYTLLSEATRTARKEHKCIWCYGAILRGEKYLDERSVYDYEFQHHHWHPECREAAKEYFRQECEFAPGSFVRGTCDER